MGSNRSLPFVRNKVAACAKHYVGDGGTVRGVDENNTVIDARGLFRIHMPAYYTSISKGVATIMVSYSSWNGKKMHSNRELITGFLKKKLKFRVNKIICLNELPCFSILYSGKQFPSLIEFFVCRDLSYQIGRVLTG